MCKSKLEFVKSQLVNMDEMAFNRDKKTKLVTDGVTSCIVFIAHGQYWYDDSQYSFSGLYHWSGFATSTHDVKAEMQAILDDFFETMKVDLDIDQDSIIDIDSLAFIGGEKRQFDQEGRCLLSGTEREVEALKNCINNYQDDKIIIPDQIDHVHYLTKGEESLSIEVTMNGWRYSIQKAEAMLEDEEELTSSFVKDPTVF